MEIAALSVHRRALSGWRSTAYNHAKDLGYGQEIVSRAREKDMFDAILKSHLVVGMVPHLRSIRNLAMITIR